MPDRARSWVWLAVLAATTAALVALRPWLDESHATLVYLLVVLGASASGGRSIGRPVAVLAFFALNFFLLPPYHTLWVADPRDWLVLAVFLTTAAVAAQLLDHAQRQAAEARRRAEEVRGLSAEAGRAAALREAARMKDALLAAVSHDLRTPLTTIKAVAHEIWAGGDERAAVVEEEADRLGRLVANLLDFSRVEGGAVRVDAEVNAADDLIGAALRGASAALGDRVIRAPPPGGELLAGRFDLVHSVRILVNLLENAAKYSPQAQPIELSVARDGDELVLAVSDRGPGIAEEQRERVFAPFVRLGEVPDEGGSGLGLAIARGLARAQGGEVRYRSRAGGGSVFELRLPAFDLPRAPVSGA
jgi:two-component system sensor histidine kinase KdpD